MIEDQLLNPAWIDPSLDSRAVSFENPTGARGAGGTAHGGRKGRPNRRLEPGERVVLAELDGPGVIRHVWMTFPPAPPEQMRALHLEVFYDGATQPSVSVPALDFFGLPHGRPVPYQSALMAAQEGRGFNAWVPLPFRRSIRVEVVNGGKLRPTLYYQIDYTLQPELPRELGHLHVSFRRQNPTVMREDFVISEGLRGPGRFLGCNLGVRILDAGAWYGEGEVKVYRDGDREHPTICGTGLEDYVGSAWGLGSHAAPYGGAPLTRPDRVGFYRWHLLDPIVFREELRVTIQQIGAAFFPRGAEQEFEAYRESHPAAGEGWLTDVSPALHAWGIAERVDDYCATAYVYCEEPQAVPRLDLGAALADLERAPDETASPAEQMLQTLNPGA